jgi:Rrf2 family protein
MNFNKTTSYALKVLSFMAKKPDEMYSAKYLNKKLKIPYPYLRQLLTDLSKAGFISSIQGRNGGFIFAKKLNKIFIGDVICKLEGLEIFNHCIIGLEKCPFNHKCPLHKSWEDARKKITSILNKTSLADFKIKDLKK